MRLARPLDDRLVAVLLVLLGAAVLFFRLGQSPLYDWDEATYAEIAREISVFHDAVRLHWDFAPWLNKAPLYVWLTYGLFHLFGNTEFWARAVSAASGAGVVGLTYLIGRTWLARPFAALAGVLVLLSNQFIRASRWGTSDVLLTFWLLAGLYAYLRTRSNPRWWYAVGACAGLAFMTKDIASLVGPAAIGVAVLADGRAGQVLRRPEPYLALLVALVIVLPWHIAMYRWQGAEFLHQYVGYMVVERAEQQIEGHTGGLAYYAVQSALGFYPWIYLAAGGGILHVLVDVRRRSVSAVLAAFTLVVLALYTLVRSKLYWYIDPLYPLYALFAAGLVAWAWRRRGSLEVIGLTGLGLLGAFGTPDRVNHLPLVGAIVLGALVLAGGLVSLAWGRRAAPVLVASSLVFAVGGLVSILPLYELQSEAAPSLGSAARTTEGAPLVLFISDGSQVVNDNISHSLTYYSHRAVQTVVGAEQLRAAVPCGTATQAVVDGNAVPVVPPSYRFTPQANWFNFQLGSLKAAC